MAGLTSQLAAFATDTAWGLDDGHDVRATVGRAFIDTVAVTLAGRNEAVVDVLTKWVASRGRPAREARIGLGDTFVASDDAALINGAAAHALDYDDVSLCGHPSAVLVPALLAEGERLASSGATVMRAYVAGFETWAELISRDSGSHHLKGWHPTGVFGFVASAAAVACLRGVSRAVCEHALSLAASMSSGLVGNFGSMAKPFHAGRAAAGGITAVDLAGAGLRAAVDVLEHRSGFLQAISPNGNVDTESPAHMKAGHHLARCGLNIKKYPTCFATHRVIDAMLDLVHDNDLRPQHVSRVDVTIGPTQARMLHSHAPGSSLEAKFSMEFAVAAALVARRVGIEQLLDSFVTLPEVQWLFARVQTSIVHTVCTSEPTLAESDRVLVTLHDGRVLDSGEVFAARGSSTRPMRAEELRAKFDDCLLSVGWPNPKQLYEQLQGFENLPDVSLLGKQSR
ncbi:MmgE/PrpD family protein [soil metagenome]